MEKEKYLTQEAYDKLKKELKYLETEKRKEVADQLRHAVSFGDLSENAAYSDAKDAKSFLEGRIIDLRNLLDTAKIVGKEKTDQVQIGSKITLESDKGKIVFQIVDPSEVNVLKQMISYESPLGKAALGKKQGDDIEVEAPSGMVKYKIVKIEQ